MEQTVKKGDSFSSTSESRLSHAGRRVACTKGSAGLRWVHWRRELVRGGKWWVSRRLNTLRDAPECAAVDGEVWCRGKALFDHLQPICGGVWRKQKAPQVLILRGLLTGAGSGDRTRIPGLGSLCPTIGRYPQARIYLPDSRGTVNRNAQQRPRRPVQLRGDPQDSGGAVNLCHSFSCERRRRA